MMPRFLFDHKEKDQRAYESIGRPGLLPEDRRHSCAHTPILE
jgi:hypothetical protein